jgi:hypothetical protein
MDSPKGIRVVEAGNPLFRSHSIRPRGPRQRQTAATIVHKSGSGMDDREERATLEEAGSTIPSTYRISRVDPNLWARTRTARRLLPIEEAKKDLLAPIVALDNDACWSLLSPFADAYVCRHILDAPEVPAGAVELLSICLEKVLASPEFKHTTYRAGEFNGYDLPHLIETLLFVSVERAALAARYVNGDWSGIGLILPIVDRFVRAGGWSGSIMAHFLTLCERSKDHYPPDLFADQVMSVLGGDTDILKGWRGTFLPARIASLIQHFAVRDTPIQTALAQKLLRALDVLVDLGDRRSAALQLSESFREIQIA